MTPDKSIEEILRSNLTEVGFQNGNVGHYIFERDISRVAKEIESYIAGRSKSIEAEKQKDERIKELEEGLGKAIKAIKQWHNADEVWDIYFNNAPEMKSIRELLNNK